MKMLKKEILMGFSNLLFVGTILLGFNGCANQKLAQKEKVLVLFEILTAQPHCGGAAPDPSVKYPMMVPQIRREFLVFSADEKGMRNEEIGEIVTDDFGNASILLPEGNYQLWRTSKLLSLKEFTNENKMDSDFFKYAGSECFQKWKDTPDLVFKTTSDTLKLVTKVKCYIGDHPCVTYNGPDAP
jgi:hypothetical protein